MYSPKIREELIPVIHRVAKLRRVPMTHVVNEAIISYLAGIDLELLRGEVKNPPSEKRG